MSKAMVLLFAILGGLCLGQSGIAEGGALQQVNLDRAGVHKSDFNADGFADLAIGIRFEDVGTVTDAGAVSVLYGSVAGLQSTSPNDQLWTQDSPGVKDNAEVGDLFGTALATGDFNADGF